MLEHLQSPHYSSRVVVVGAAGFVGRALCQKLATDQVECLPIARQQIDFLTAAAGDQLAAELKSSDTLVVIAAEAPCKNTAMLYRNIRIMHAICTALQKQTVSHVIYISSDAVYADSEQPLNERSITAPQSLHGIMHLSREMMLQTSCSESHMPLAILRPSLLYGANDPHNGYGPNRFRRLVNDNKPIVLFGEGEEQRDHVYIEDVATLLANVIQHRSQGILNIATGQVHSFKAIAMKVIALAQQAVDIQTLPRSGPMPHNGYRPFDITACKKAFPNFELTSLDEGLTLSQNKMNQEKELV